MSSRNCMVIHRFFIDTGNYLLTMTAAAALYMVHDFSRLTSRIILSDMLLCYLEFHVRMAIGLFAQADSTSGEGR